MSKPFKELPAWVTVVIAVVTIICSAGATWATTGFRISALEQRADTIETASAGANLPARVTAVEKDTAEIKADRQRRIDDYEKFKADIRVDIADIKGDIRVIRQAVERKQ